MKAAAKFAFGADALAGKKIAVQGCGSVGQALIAYLVKEGATVYVNDIFDDKVAETVNKYGVKAITTEELFHGAFDIYAPCALGATVNDEMLSSMNVSVIAGAANNQLQDEEKHGRMVREKGIVYAPDFVINAGGLINVYAEYVGNYNLKNAMDKTENIYNVILQVLQNASAHGTTSLQAAKNLAEQRIQEMSAFKTPLHEMLNRRMLRIKVMQALYGFFQSGSSDLGVAENGLFRSLDRIYDLYTAPVPAV